MYVDVHRPWRHAKVTDRRASADFAECMRDLVDDHYPEAELIRVVLDNLSTHTAAALYGLPKSLRRLFRSEHDPRLTPYLRSVADVRALAAKLPEWARAAYALGSLAGLRTGEILALDWDAVQLEVPRVEVRRQVRDGDLGPLKDDEARILSGPWLGALAAALRPWRLRSGGKGLLFPPPTGERCSAAFVTPHRLYAALEEATTAAGLAHVMAWSKPWYQATRHTFASHWIGTGRPIAQLAAILGTRRRG